MTPLSGDDAARRRQLANLKRGREAPTPPAPPVGNQRARVHGGYAVVAVERLDAKGREIYEALAADAPLRGPDGGLPRADAVAVELLAESLCRRDDVRRWLDDYGKRDPETGEARRSLIDLERRLRAEALDLCRELGMTPTSRAKLGLDLAHGRDLALEWAEEGGE